MEFGYTKIKNNHKRQKHNKTKKLRIIPLGGCEEVGRNMTVFEYGKDIVILDMGVQFPEEDMPGIDFVIPNTRYLHGKEKNIRGVIFSHGHLDHIGAAPILLEKLGNPPIIGMDLTLALIKHRQEDHQKGSAKKLRAIPVKNISQTVKLGSFTIRFFRVEHSIVDAVGTIIESPAATVIHPGDWTLDRTPEGKPTVDYSQLKSLPRPTVLMLESLGSVNTKRSGNSEEMHKNLYQLIEGAAGRVIVGTFSSQIERTKWIIEAAQKLGRKVALDGYSMKINIDIARRLGYIKTNPDVLIDIKKIKNYLPRQIIVICTGAQGEKNAVFSRIINKTHRHIQLRRDDTIIFSSSVIPGNERAIQRIKDNMYRQSDHVFHNEVMDVHVSGHANREDIVEMLKTIQPDYFIPVYANHYMLKEAAMLAQKNGFLKDHIIVPDNGSIIEISHQSAQVLKKKAPSNYVFVDGLGISDTQNVVLRDRQVLAEDGMVVVIVSIDSATGKLTHSPDLISRGFVFLKENKQLIEELRGRAQKAAQRAGRRSWPDKNQIRNAIRDDLGKAILAKTHKRPMILPVIMDV